MKQPIIQSKYNKKEVFDFDKTPGEFKSVTEKSINDIKSYCTRIITTKYKGSHDARALYAMVGTVVGNFDLLTSRLKEDYANRRNKLKKAQRRGVAKVNERVIAYEKLVSNHEMAKKLFGENIAEYGGYDSLVPGSQKERIAEFKNRLTIIEEKNYEA